MVTGFVFGLGASVGGLLFVFGVMALNWFVNGRDRQEAKSIQQRSLDALIERNKLTIEANATAFIVMEAVQSIAESVSEILSVETTTFEDYEEEEEVLADAIVMIEPEPNCMFKVGDIVSGKLLSEDAFLVRRDASGGITEYLLSGDEFKIVDGD